MSTRRSTLHNNMNLNKQVEKEFEAVRQEYLRELKQLRSKYQRTLARLTIKYAVTCGIQSQLDGRVLK